MSHDITRERRRTARTASDPHYDAFTDRRQPLGVVASYVRVHGGELCRSRVHYLHLARILAARLHDAMGTREWEPGPNLRTVGKDHFARPINGPRLVARIGTVTWTGKRHA